jgi:hypothetical protein
MADNTGGDTAMDTAEGQTMEQLQVIVKTQNIQIEGLHKNLALVFEQNKLILDRLGALTDESKAQNTGKATGVNPALTGTSTPVILTPSGDEVPPNSQVLGANPGLSAGSPSVGAL